MPTISGTPPTEKNPTKLMEQWMKNNVDLFLQFKNPELSNEYREYHSTHQHYISKLSLPLLLILIFLPCTLGFTVSLSWLYTHDESPTTRLLTLIFYFALILLLVVLTLFQFLYFYEGDLTTKPILKFLKGNISFIRLFLYFFVPIFFSLHFIFRIANGQCPENQNGWKNFYCNPHAITYGIPVDSLFLLIAIPRLLFFLFREIPPQCRIIQLFLVYGTLLGSYIYINFSQYYLVIILQFLSALFIMYESRYFQMTLYFMYVSLKQVIEENEKKADEVHATELRHMIGNVAHDLKTVSFPSDSKF